MSSSTLPAKVPVPNTTPASSELLYLVANPYTSPSDDASTAGNVITKAHGLSDGIVKISSGIMAPATSGSDYSIPFAQTATKTTTYSASVNDLVIADATSGSFVVNLPTTPTNKSVLSVKKIDSTANTVTITCGGSDTFTGGGTTLVLSLQGQSSVMTYNTGTAKWVTISNDLPLGQTDTRYLRVSNNLSDVTAATARTNLGLGTIAVLSAIDLTANVGSSILPIANGGTGSATQNFVDLSTTAQTLGDGKNIAVGTTTGTQVGTGTTQKLGFWGATPIVQTGNGVELFTGLSNAGIRTAGGAPPITTSGAVQLNGSVRTSQASLSGTASLAVGTAMWTQLCDATSGIFTVTLTATTNKGYRFTIKKTDASANAVTVSAGAGTIDGSATYSLASQYKYVTVESTGTSGLWYIVGNN